MVTTMVGILYNFVYCS